MTSAEPPSTNKYDNYALKFIEWVKKTYRKAQWKVHKRKVYEKANQLNDHQEVCAAGISSLSHYADKIFYILSIFTSASKCECFIFIRPFSGDLCLFLMRAEGVLIL